ncbi:DUF3037 domain-containing protein [Ilyomonas limi]|uniref:DUF3037 domain-containing protein n=1 Tax=Ilyomonas limi TaxID=2575867 RepID=A0A4U3L7U4_9BACT|nr:DUF3037 domain-containing protein [Ilyomonas limi]TKK69747.1 DUF3037 domain-containing protein [Ilyomonas limi]
MPEMHLYEYAVIRIVPRVEREEFMNAGVIMFCAAQRFLEVKCRLETERLQAFRGEINIQEIQTRLAAFEQICKGGKEGGPIGQLSQASRFRWLTAARSTVVQTSRVHPGLCVNAVETLEILYEQLVL